MQVTQDSTSGRRDLSRIRLGHVPLILMYHAVGSVPADPYKLCVTSARFSEQMTWLARQGLRGVSIDTLVTAMRVGKDRGLVGITFDDGYVNVLDNAVPELLRHNFTATMFIVSGQLGKTNEWDKEPVWALMSAGQVTELASVGMEIGSHTVMHPALRGLSEPRLKAEISESRTRLSQLIGRPVHGFAYPYGLMDAPARRAVSDAGYGYACSVVSPVADLGIMALPRVRVSQGDRPFVMSARRATFRAYTAAKSATATVSDSHLGQAVRRPHPAIERRSTG
jgi:peptidoglycan/xylan/chitin deacetylase (PgdA/CDA1 family)